jgi:hypothetical protein
MAIVIDALDIVHNRKSLPVEGFFVDTQMIIYYKDPFGKSGYKDRIFDNLNINARETLQYLKGQYKTFSTLSVALEYYKYLQVNSYLLYKQTTANHQNIKFDSDDFKNLRENDVTFRGTWEKYLESFKKVFTKNFQLVDISFDTNNILTSFKGTEMDFGDHLLYNVVTNSNAKYHCVFSNDIDFYSCPDDVFFLTFNNKAMGKEKLENKLYKITRK